MHPMMSLPDVSFAAMQILSYLFYPNPGNAAYTSPKALLLLAVCAGLLLIAASIKVWRMKLKNPVTKKLSGTWPASFLWFGIVGLVLVVSRVENIQFLAMRFLWVLWGASFFLFVFFQAKRYRMRNYEVLPKVVSTDPRSKYLPGKKKR